MCIYSGSCVKIQFMFLLLVESFAMGATNIANSARVPIATDIAIAADWEIGNVSCFACILTSPYVKIRITADSTQSCFAGILTSPYINSTISIEIK